MKKLGMNKLCGFVGVVLVSSTCGVALAQPRPAIVGYWLDSSNAIVKNSFGQCWRTSSWTPALAVAECDSSLVAKAAPQAKAAPAPVMAPSTSPAVSTYKIVITEKSIHLTSANFAINSSRLTPGAHEKLNEAVQLAKKRLDLSFNISGHTDSTGNAQRNQALSKKRAEAVKDYLVSKGVVADRLSTQGFGQDKPVADNKTASGRTQNRRADIEYIEKVETKERVTP